MPSSYVRKIIDLNQGSCVVCLPKAWMRYLGLNPGDQLEVISNGDLTIRPLKRADSNPTVDRGLIKKP